MNVPCVVIDSGSLEFSLMLLSVVAMVIGIISAYLKMRAYRSILQMIGANGGGFEKINGKWYRITECSESDIEIIEDMGMPSRVRNV